MAGFKAIVVWFPPRRVVVANGWLVMLGALEAKDPIGYGANLPPPSRCETQISGDQTRSPRRHPMASTRKAPETARR